MLTLLSVLFLMAKGFCPIGMLIFSFIIIFALNIHRVHIQVSVDVLLHYTHVLKKHFLNGGLRRKKLAYIFLHKCEM